ncbi:MAG: tRNA 2-thiouridine(34) synthase MnmA [Chloroflexi bacterium]|nr:MAG: tRNA 2-thiouridine(34) synthase MnmA [Chloroflexota bacterium]
MARVMVAMSGGVASSVVAAMLHNAGHEVTGVTMHLWEGDGDKMVESRCCSMEMVSGARRVCAQLGIPYYVFNYQKDFKKHVINYFADEYSNGMTPNPCMACNRDLKFRVLLERAELLGFDALATGHYLQNTFDGTQWRMSRGNDMRKDQSYMLHMLGQKELSRLMFPLGAMTKPEVRALASQLELATAERPESQDICFVPDRDYRSFVKSQRPDAFAAGNIVDQQGTTVGTHQGIPLYTVGQRKGLGLAVGTPLFVTHIDAQSNTIVVGPQTDLKKTTIQVDRATYVAGTPPDNQFSCLVQSRSHAPAVAAQVTVTGAQTATVTFDEPQDGISPGQSAVFYADTEVIGGGRILV